MPFTLLPSYGTISLTNGSATISGTSTIFTNYRTGYLLLLPDGLTVEFASDPTSDAEATSVLEWGGSNVTDSAYQAIARDPGSEVALQQRIYNQYLSSTDVLGVPFGWTFHTSVSETDPGPGYLRLNNATAASATELYISDTDANGNPVGVWLDTLLSSQFVIRSAQRPNQIAVYSVTSVSDETGWHKLTITHVDGTPSFLLDEDLVFNAGLAGPQGNPGDNAYVYIAYASDVSGTDFTTIFDATLPYIAILATDTAIPSPAVGDFAGLWKPYEGQPVGHGLVFDDTTSDANPGAGTFRADNATFGSITKLWINNADADALDITDWLDSFDDVSNANARGYLTLQGQYDPSIKMEFAVTGGVTDKTGYREIAVSPISGAIPADASVLVASFAKSGADGAGTGDVVGPASATDAAPVLFDGTTGKLLKNGTFASQAEAEAGTDTAKFMNPLRTSQAIAALAPQPGPAFRAYATGTTSITSSYNKVALAGEDFDTDDAFDAVTNYRFQPSVAGYYQINVGVYFSSSAYEVVLQLRKNGAGVTFGGLGIASRAGLLSDIVYLNGTTDYVELFAFSATTQNTTASQTGTFMSGALLKAA
jgi:hypothetical protein